MSRLSQIVTEAVDRKLGEGRVTAGDIAMYAQREYADVLHDESSRLMREALHRLIKRELSQRTDGDEGEQPLPGLGLPSAIYVPGSEDYYVRADAATWGELVAGRRVRVDNITHAERRLTQYDDALDRLRPYMAAAPERSVAEALRAMQEDAA